ncbi:MAG TPA: IS1634 family transposase, partial [Puia sp.]|nr:IS1634 family transposase [Puia sp.]
YALSVTRDGAIPIHFKAYDGNRTDDTLHWDTWLTLRGIVGRSDFLYVADSKLCVAQILMNMDRNQGRFITMLPRTRSEVKEFNNKLLISEVRWEKIYSKRSSRNPKKVDIYETAIGLYQMKEGFRLHWFRSSMKKRRDFDEREEKILTALDHLRELNNTANTKTPRTEKKFRKKVNEIINKFGVGHWVHADITLEKREEFKQKKRGPATKETTYRKIIRMIPRIHCHRNLDGIAKSEAMDGLFPLATNTNLTPVEVLKSYKYQPTLEKRHSTLKSVLQVAPVFLKKNDRIEALMFVYFLAQIISALIERQVRIAMIKQGKKSIQILPEERPSRHPTTEQVFRLFQHQARRLLYSGKNHIQTFSEPLTVVQKEILGLLNISHSIY